MVVEGSNSRVIRWEIIGKSWENAWKMVIQWDFKGFSWDITLW
jgi:hypothetical protein